jgi:hypothetical protein
MANDDPCKKVLKNTCGETQCSVEYLFDHWPTDCKKVFELGQCVNVYQLVVRAHTGTSVPMA